MADMKKIFFLLLVLCSYLTSFAQISPENMIPKIPDIQSVCGMGMEEKDRYMAQISDASGVLDDELYERRMERKANEKKFEQQAKANVATEYGLSAADMAKMENMKNMSKAERDRTRREMADKMAMNTGGISMQEIDNIKGDTAAMRSWGQSYGTQKMAEASVDPQKAQKEQQQNQNMYDLVTLQKKLVDSLNSAEGKYFRKFDELEQDPLIVTLRKEIDSLRGEMSSLMGVDAGQGDQIQALFESVKSKSLSYCNRFTSPYLDVLSSYYFYVKASVPAWKRLQKINIRIAELQTGVKMEEKDGTLALECIQRYMKKLDEVDKYYLMPFDAEL